MVIRQSSDFLQGMMKTVWKDAWVLDGRLRADTGSRKRELGLIQRYVKEVRNTMLIIRGGTPLISYSSSNGHRLLVDFLRTLEKHVQVH